MSDYVISSINVSAPLMLAKLAIPLLLLNFVDAKQCGTVHAQSKNKHVWANNGSCSSCTMCI